MTLIQKIQKRTYLLVILIALALISFLFMDINQNASLISRGMTDVGSVNGESLSYEEFEKQYKALEASVLEQRGGQPLNDEEQTQLRNQVWQDFVKANTINKCFEDLGLQVTSRELAELTMGENADESVKQMQLFKNAKGVFDPVLVSNFVSSLKSDPAKRKQWMNFEKQIKDNRLSNKFQSLIEGSFIIPKWLNDFDFHTYNRKVDFDYVFVPYTAVNDKDVKIDDKEMKAYFEKNKGKFADHQEYVKVAYALFPIKPSAADSLELLTQFNQKVELMRNSTNDTNFMRSYADNKFDEKMYKKEELSRFANVDEIMAAPVGGIVGPFVMKNQFKAIKVLAKRNISDSVQVREIVISFKNHMQSQEAVQNRMKLVDSVFRMLDTLNMNFDQVAAQYSEDKGQSSPKWINVASGENPDIFYKGGLKKYFKSPSDREGLVRIYQVVKYPATIPAVQIGELSGPFAPSESTSNMIYTKANEFKNSIKTEKDIEKNIAKYPGSRSAIAYISPAETQLGGIEGSPRELVRWCYDSKDNEVSNLITVGDHYVIAINLGSRQLDKISYEMCKDEVKELYLQEAKSKLIMDKLSKSKSLDESASMFNVQKSSAKEVTFQKADFAGTPEPAPIAYMIYAPLNKLSKPIKGFAGVIQIVPTFMNSIEGDPDLMLDLQTQIQLQYKGIRGVIESMQSTAKIEDRRMNFF